MIENKHKLEICFGPLKILALSNNVLILRYIRSLKYLHTFLFKTSSQINENIPIFEVVDGKKVDIKYYPNLKKLKLFLNWEEFNKTTIIEEVLWQYFFLISIENENWPMHAASVEYGDEGILLVGATTSGKTSIALGLCNLGKYRWIADDWLSLKLINHEVFINDKDNLISIRKFGFEDIEKIFSKSVGCVIKKRFGNGNSPLTKTIPPLSSSDLKINEASLPLKVRKIFFVQIINNKFYCEKVSKGRMINLIANEYVKALNGYSGYFIDNKERVNGKPIVTVPGLGWKKILLLVDELSDICQGYFVSGSLKEVVNKILEINNEK